KLAHDTRTITLPKRNDTAENAKQTTAVLRGKIDDIVYRYGVVTDRLAEVFAKLRDLLGDTTPDIRKFLADLAVTTASLKEKLPPILDDFQNTVHKVNQELESTGGILASIRDTVN